MPQRITLALVSHTNLGKTTLARTLLAQDIGEVRDAAHVTEFADEHLLLATATGHELWLADTPGFGDSVRLARRMRGSGNPLGWFLSEVWDRWRDRAFWHSQQALRQARERSDVVLYLVNAAESPASAGYVTPEMELLAWLGKPVIVLVNQLGAPREDSAEAADVQRWRSHLQAWPAVRSVLPMDAFARCWVQEGVLWRHLQPLLDGPARAAMAELHAAWAAARLATFDASMQVLADSLARVAATRVDLGQGGGGLRGTLRQLGSALGLGPSVDPTLEPAHEALLKQLDGEVKASTARLIELHGLRGEATGVVLQRVASAVVLRRKVGEGGAAVLGSVLSGALTGLATDLATGGLTLGGGLIAGGVLGALGAAGVARGLNVVRGTDHSWAGWHADAMTPIVRAAVLRYLAVAHFGRGRGDWADGEAPAHWASRADAVLQDRRTTLTAIWTGPGDAARMAAALKPELALVLRTLLEQLYPGTWPGELDNPSP